MKKLIILSSLLATSAVSAGTCKIKARIYESNFACPLISINKFKNVDETQCLALVEEALDTHLFRILDIKRGEKIMHLDYTFKEGKYKVKERVVLQDWNEFCN